MRKETSGQNSSNNQKIQDIMSRHYNRRRVSDKIVSVFAVACVLAAIIPLGSILLEVIKNGASAISIQLLTQPPGAIGSTLEDSGGIAPAIQGTLIVVGLASAIGVPIGILAGIYLSEFASGAGLFSTAVRVFNDVLTGLPSVVIGIVGYVTIVLTIGSFSVLAGAFSLSIIMIPIVVRITEETLKVVPNSIREAGYSLGIPQWKITL